MTKRQVIRMEPLTFEAAQEVKVRTQQVPELSESSRILFSKIRPMSREELDAAFIKAGLKKSKLRY